MNRHRQPVAFSQLAGVVRAMVAWVGDRTVCRRGYDTPLAWGSDDHGALGPTGVKQW